MLRNLIINAIEARLSKLSLDDLRELLKTLDKREEAT